MSSSDKKTQMGTPAPRSHPPASTPPPAQTPLPENTPAAGAAPYTPPPDPLVGQTLVGRYFIDKKLGEGGMGAVYLAQHVTLEKHVALKVLHGEFARKPDLVQRFLQEAKAASRIRHENVIDITDFGTTPEGLVFFAMELLKGHDLHDEIARARIEQRRLPWDRTRGIFLQICSALSAAHAQGIIHRDLKPENIYLVEWLGHKDFVKLLDFGIAKLTEVEGDEERKLTRTGMLFGTPEYMSPEQARGEKPDHRVDVYAMGCILFQMIRGRVPFEADNFMGVLSLHLTAEPPMLTHDELDAVGAPRGLENVVAMALAKERDERFASIDDLAAAVRALEGEGEGPPVHVPTPGSGRTRTKWTGSVSLPDAEPDHDGDNKPVGLYVVVALLLVALAGGGIFFATQGGGDSGVATDDTEEPDDAEEPDDTDEPAAAVVPAQVTLTLASDPDEAEVIDQINGQVMGSTPLEFDLPGSDEPRRFRFRKKGYQDKLVELIPLENIEYEVLLTERKGGADDAEAEVEVIPQKIRRPRDPKPDTKPDLPRDTKPEPKPDTKPDSKPEPDTKPDTKPDPKPDTKPDPKPDDPPDDPVIKDPFANP